MSQLCVLSVIMNSEIDILSKSEFIPNNGKMYRHTILPILLTNIALLIQNFDNNNFISMYELADQGGISEFSPVSVFSVFLFFLHRFHWVWQKNSTEIYLD